MEDFKDLKVWANWLCPYID